MSATNHTTNYNLPQFIGTDKPTWLTDVNNAFSAIDTQMKSNADNASSASSSATSASTAVGTLANLNTTDKTSCVNAINEVNTNLGTTSGVVTSQGNAIATNASDIARIYSKLTLSDVHSVDPATLFTNISSSTSGSLTLAQSADGSVFKFYGYVEIRNNTSSTISQSLTSVAGYSNHYGIATGLFLNSNHTAYYTINPCGNEVIKNLNSDAVKGLWSSSITVGTDNQIYLLVGSNSSQNINAKEERKYFFMSCIYFDTDFGDNPQE